MSQITNRKKENITCYEDVIGIFLRVSITGLILIWPFELKREFYCSSGSPVNSINKVQKSQDCGLNEKQESTVISVLQRGWPLRAGGPAFLLTSVFYEPWMMEQTGFTEGRTWAISESSTPLLRGCSRQTLPLMCWGEHPISHPTSLSLRSTLNFSPLAEGYVTPKNVIFSWSQFSAN